MTERSDAKAEGERPGKGAGPANTIGTRTARRRPAVGNSKGARSRKEKDEKTTLRKDSQEWITRKDASEMRRSGSSRFDGRELSMRLAVWRRRQAVTLGQCKVHAESSVYLDWVTAAQCW
jgi:hypothetical protein